LLFGLTSFSPAARLLPLFRYPNDALARLVAGSIPRLDEDGGPERDRVLSSNSPVTNP
jgi:hypothetical protein